MANSTCKERSLENPMLNRDLFPLIRSEDFSILKDSRHRATDDPLAAGLLPDLLVSSFEKRLGNTVSIDMFLCLDAIGLLNVAPIRLLITLPNVAFQARQLHSSIVRSVRSTSVGGAN